MTEALKAGSICAVAGQGQRQMSGWAAEYPGLYAAEAFDPALYGTLALASAFSGPWYGAAELRMANRTCLWCFGLDWLVDYAATSAAEVDEIVRSCTAVVDGADPVDELTAFLASIRDELAALPSFAVLGPVWRDELRRMLAAMALEWEWKSGTRPDFEDYLRNADNLGFCFVFTAHWIATTPQPALIDEVRTAGRAVQRVIRLLNDLGTYERDRKWGDLNALMLDLGRPAVQDRVTELTAEARRLIGGVRDTGIAEYLERQMDFCAGFYGITDFWGAA